jgi:hypothetical protein
MKYQLPICATLLIAVSRQRPPPRSPRTPRRPWPVPPRKPLLLRRRRSSRYRSRAQVSDKPVARVNGAVLTDRDLLREMYAIFPYARQHNGFPKAQEARFARARWR